MKQNVKILSVLLALVTVFAVTFAVSGCQEDAVEYKITFLAQDDTELQSLKVEEGKTPEFTGTMPALPEETAEKSYAWEWDKPIVPATADATYKLVLKETVKTYTVTFMIGKTKAKEETVNYGTTVTAPDATKAADAQYTYEFDGWYTAEEDGEKVTDFTVTGNATYYARFTPVLRKYTIRFVDGETVKTMQVGYGAMPEAPEITTVPTEGKIAIWSPSISAVTGNATYEVVMATPLNSETVGDTSQFKALLNNSSDYFVLTENLDFKNAQTEGTIVFNGTLDGRGYGIKNLLIHFDERGSDWNSYLFTENNGTICNLGVEYLIKTNGSKNGFILTNNGTISNVYVSAKVGNINDQWNFGPVTSNNFGTIENCVSVLSFDSGVATTDYVGSVVCRSEEGSFITNCYGVTNGYVTEVNGELPCVKEVSKGTMIGNKNYTTVEALVADASFNAENGWNTALWKVTDDGKLEFGMLHYVEPAVTLTKDNFISAITAKPSGNFVLAADVDFEGATLYANVAFSGVLDGKGFALRNFVVENNEGNTWMLASNAGTIKNVAFYYTLNADTEYSCLIKQNDGTIENCYIESTFTKSVWHTSPLVGLNNGTVSNCITHIKGTSNGGVGSIVANGANGTIKNCYSATNNNASYPDKPFLDSFGNERTENFANYTTMEELAAAVTFTADDGWNMDYAERIFAEVIAQKN